jgi:hypothetical protein
VRGIWTQKKEKNFATFVSFYYYVKAIMVVVVGLWDLFPTQFKNLYQLFLPPLLYHPNVNFSFYFLCCNKPQNNSLYFFFFYSNAAEVIILELKFFQERASLIITLL